MNAGSDDGLRGAARRKGTFVRTFHAVAWSFFGVRKSSDLEKDASELNPQHVVIAGLLLAAFGNQHRGLRRNFGFAVQIVNCPRARQSRR